MTVVFDLGQACRDWPLRNPGTLRFSDAILNWFAKFISHLAPALLRRSGPQTAGSTTLDVFLRIHRTHLASRGRTAARSNRASAPEFLAVHPSHPPGGPRAARCTDCLRTRSP